MENRLSLKVPGLSTQLLSGVWLEPDNPPKTRAETCPIFIVEAESKYQSIYIFIIRKHFSHLEKKIIVSIVSGMKVSFFLWVKKEVLQIHSHGETVS